MCLRVKHFFISALTVWFISCSSTVDTHSSFLDVIDALDQAEPIDTAVVKKLVSPTVRCSEDGVRLDCKEDGAKVGDIGDVIIDFRSTPRQKSSIIVFSNLHETCMSLAQLEKRFGSSEVRRDGTDGIYYYYHRFQRRAAVLSVILDRADQCARQVILDSYR